MTKTPVAARLLKDPPAHTDDRIVLDHDGRLLRRKLLTTAGGRAFLVSLPAVTNLDDHWGFELEDGTTVCIDAAPETVLVVTGDLTRLAWHVGNRHTPCQILPDRLMIREDHVLEAMLKGLGATITRASLPFKPEGGAYGHGRTMGHSQGPDEPARRLASHPHRDGKAHFHAPEPAKTAP